MDPEAGTVIHNLEQEDWFGRSTVYLNNEADDVDYLGGSLDPTHLVSTDDIEWSPSVSVIRST